MEIVIDTDLSNHTLFQSAKHTKNTIFLPNPQNHATFSRQIHNADDNTGDCHIEITKRNYSHEILIKDIKCTIPSATLENFVLLVYNVLSIARAGQEKHPEIECRKAFDILAVPCLQHNKMRLTALKNNNHKLVGLDIKYESNKRWFYCSRCSLRPAVEPSYGLSMSSLSVQLTTPHGYTQPLPPRDVHRAQNQSENQGVLVLLLLTKQTLQS